MVIQVHHYYVYNSRLSGPAFMKSITDTEQNLYFCGMGINNRMLDMKRR